MWTHNISTQQHYTDTEPFHYWKGRGENNILQCLWYKMIRGCWPDKTSIYYFAPSSSRTVIREREGQREIWSFISNLILEKPKNAFHGLPSLPFNFPISRIRMQWQTCKFPTQVITKNNMCEAPVLSLSFNDKNLFPSRSFLLIEEDVRAHSRK